MSKATHLQAVTEWASTGFHGLAPDSANILVRWLERPQRCTSRVSGSRS